MKEIKNRYWKKLEECISLCNNIYTIVWEQRKLMEVAEYRNGKAHEREFIEKIEGCSDLLLLDKYGVTLREGLKI